MKNMNNYGWGVRWVINYKPSF